MSNTSKSSNAIDVDPKKANNNSRSIVTPKKRRPPQPISSRPRSAKERQIALEKVIAYRKQFQRSNKKYSNEVKYIKEKEKGEEEKKEEEKEEEEKEKEEEEEEEEEAEEKEEDKQEEKEEGKKEEESEQKSKVKEEEETTKAEKENPETAEENTKSKKENAEASEESTDASEKSTDSEAEEENTDPSETNSEFELEKENTEMSDKSTEFETKEKIQSEAEKSTDTNAIHILEPTNNMSKMVPNTAHLMDQLYKKVSSTENAVDETNKDASHIEVPIDETNKNKCMWWSISSVIGGILLLITMYYCGMKMLANTTNLEGQETFYNNETPKDQEMTVKISTSDNKLSDALTGISANTEILQDTKEDSLVQEAKPIVEQKLIVEEDCEKITDFFKDYEKQMSSPNEDTDPNALKKNFFEIQKSYEESSNESLKHCFEEKKKELEGKEEIIPMYITISGLQNAEINGRYKLLRMQHVYKYNGYKPVYKKIGTKSILFRPDSNGNWEIQETEWFVEWPDSKEISHPGMITFKQNPMYHEKEPGYASAWERKSQNFDNAKITTEKFPLKQDE